MKKDKILFIAEIGNNHNGDLDRAKRLIEICAQVGCNVAKFQLRDFNTLYRKTGLDVEDLGVEYTKDLLRKYELPATSHFELAKYCEHCGIEYMCTPWDERSVDLLEEIGVKRYKVASADFDNIPLIQRLLQTNKPIILSTGMANFQQICERVEFLDQNCAKYTLLHCNSTYPAPFEDIELNFIKTLKSVAKNVGYSGHERGISVSLGAIALGSTVIERHITEDKSLEGPDHEASLLPDEFESLIRFGRELQISLGEDEIQDRKLSQGALLNKETLGKSIVAREFIRRGTVLRTEDIVVRAPGQGLPPSEIENLVGKIVQKDIEPHEFIFHRHFNDSTEFWRRPKFPHENWGIPVRPHDVKLMHKIFDAPVYEFHVSYQDLERELPDEDWSFLQEKKILVHAPELFKNSKLLDLCDNIAPQLHIENLNLVCDFCRKISKAIGTKQTIKIITNIGGFSTHEFRPESEKQHLYDVVGQRLAKIDETGCEVTIQNMAPFPWHFGGQRYQNIFAYPSEIIEFCEKFNRKITLDTAHLSMHCSFRKENFIQSISDLSPWIAHWHMSDAQGINGEGVAMGEGDVNFRAVLQVLTPEQTFIVETWQGHKNNGYGFKTDLAYLRDARI